jgi:hypothetical protein
MPPCILVNPVEMNYLNLVDDISNGKTEYHHYFCAEQ